MVTIITMEHKDFIISWAHDPFIDGPLENFEVSDRFKIKKNIEKYLTSG